MTAETLPPETERQAHDSSASWLLIFALGVASFLAAAGLVAYEDNEHETTDDHDRELARVPSPEYAATAKRRERRSRLPDCTESL